MIHAGTVFLEKSAARPNCFRPAGEACPEDWTSISPSLSPLAEQAELASTGWTFFFMGRPITTRVYGFDGIKALATALERLVAMVREQGCNGLQIDTVVNSSYLGVPSVTVSAHPRHIQKGMAVVAH